MRGTHKRTRKTFEDVTIDLSTVAPNGHWWSIPNIISHLSQYLPISYMIASKTLCKNWYKAMNHQFLREYIRCFLKLNNERMDELDLKLSESKLLENMVSSYEEMIDILVKLDFYENINHDYVDRIKLLTSEYEKLPDLKNLEEISKLTKIQMRKHHVPEENPISISIYNTKYVCNNCSIIRYVVLKDENICADFKGLYVVNEVKEFILVLSNGYPMMIRVYLEAGRYDGRCTISMNGRRLFDFDWHESDYEETHDFEQIQSLRNILDFNLDTTVSDEIYQTILFAWLNRIGPSKIGDIPDMCFGTSVLNYRYK